MPRTAFSIRFRDEGDFAAERRAVDLLDDYGFSVGRMEAHSPRGILFGAYDIQKWRNLNRRERSALHGIMTGDMRNGPVLVELFDSAPAEAHAAMAAFRHQVPA